MVENVEKCKKRVIKWDQIVYHLGRHDVECDFLRFKTEHKNFSMSRCAFYVLKKYYRAPLLSAIRSSYRHGQCYEELCKWIHFYTRLGEYVR